MKKFILTLAMFSLLFSYHANALVVINNANQASTVKLKTGMFANSCATEIPFGTDAYTPSHSQKTYDWSMVQLMCGNIFPCSAEFFIGDNISCDPSQGDIYLGEASISEDGHIDILNVKKDTPYHLIINGDTVTLSDK